MKKILLSLLLLNACIFLKAQIVFNEFYMEPGSTEKEFVEFYNQSGATENLECYVAVFFYRFSSTDRGFIVLDMPARMLGSKKVGVASTTIPFDYQGGTYTSPHPDSSFAWTGLTGTSYVRDYKINTAGTAYLAPTTPSNLNDILRTISTGSTKYQFFLFRGLADGTGGRLVNALSINGPEALHPDARSAPDLAIDDPDGGGGPCSGFTIKWTQNSSSEGAIVGVPNNGIEYMGSAIGSSNGAKRIRDGQCGAWTKSSSQVNHTPGTLNGVASDADSQIASFATFGSCATYSQTNNYDITYGITSAPANYFNITIELWEDLGEDLPGTLNIDESKLQNGVDGNDVLRKSDVVSSAPTGTFVYNVNPAYDASAYSAGYTGLREARRFYIKFLTQGGCFDKITEQSTCSALPVNLKSFTAIRNRSNVLLKWETVSEEKNLGFDVQRFIGSGNWESVGFVASKASDGYSNSQLNYEFTDINNIKGITQYRLQLLDMDGKSSYSMIRSIRGEGQSGKTIVYPNPSNNGKVNVVFEDHNVIRDVTLIDMNGRSIKQWRGTSNNNIQIDNLNAGFYTIIIVNRETGEQVAEKILVQKR